MLSHCRYFDKTFAERFVEWSSTKHIILDQTSQFDWVVMATEMFICEIVFKKNQLLRTYKGGNAEAVELFIILASMNILVLLPLLRYFGCYGNFKFT